MGALSVGIKGKLVLLIVAALLCFGGTVTYSLIGLRKVSKQVEIMDSVTIPFTAKAGAIRARANALMRFIWRSALVDVHGEERKTTLARVVEYQKNLSKDIDDLQAFKTISPEVTPLAEELLEAKGHMMPMVNQAIALLEARTPAANQELSVNLGKTLAPAAVHVNEIGLKLSELADKISDQESERMVEHTKALQLYVLLIACGTGVLFLAVAFVFATRISRQLTRITNSVSGASQQVSAASEHLSTASEQLSSSSQEQASALEQTSASLTEIATMSDANANGAEQVDKSVKEVFQISDETRKSMVELATAMKLILESNGRIEKLVKVIEEIGEKTEVIDEIVFKTQLLSFNASVEAERAGEHGRGFAVVAQEVGNLALVSGRAAQEISSIVKTSIKEAEAVATENKERVESGGALAQMTKDKMETVLTNLNGIINSVDKIVSACREQKQGISQISTSIQSLSQATQETAGTAEESASASVELSGQGASLLGLVSELRKLVTGTDAGDALNAPSPMSASTGVRSAAVNVVPLKSAGVRRIETTRAPVKSTGTDGSIDAGTAWEKL